MAGGGLSRSLRARLCGSRVGNDPGRTWARHVPVLASLLERLLRGERKAAGADGVLDQLSRNLRVQGESAQATLGALSGAIAQQLNALADEARLLIH